MSNPIEEFQTQLNRIEAMLIKMTEQNKPHVLSAPQYLYSIKELAEFLKCSIPTAQKIKKSGKIRYKQIGRKLIFSCSEILEDLNKQKVSYF